MARTRQDNDMVPITAADMDRFYRHAWAAVKRREGNYAFDEFGNGLRSIFLGGVPVIGLLWFDWSAAQMMLFLLVGTWTAILCDFAKLWFLEKSIRERGNSSYDDWHVWTVVAALRAGRTTAPKTHLRAKYEPWAGVLVDIVFGGMASVLIPVALAEAGSKLSLDLLEERGVLLSLVGVVAYQILFTIWEIVSHKHLQPGNREVKIAVGMRGLGLFILLFLMVFLVDNASTKSGATWTTMLVVNSAIVLLGVVTMIGPHFIRKETAWLREHLQKRDAEQRKGR